MVDVDRLIATILLNVYRGEGAPAYLPEDVYPLITDTKKRLITKEEYQEFNEVMDSVKWQSN